MLLIITVTTTICLLIPPNLSIQIFLRPNTLLNYVGQLMCKHRNSNIMHQIDQDTPRLRDGCRYSFINLRMDFANCDPNDPNVTMKISDNNSNELHEFVFPKWQLSARNTALVLGFGIEPLAEKTFHLLNANEDDEQNGSLINYGIKLACNIRPPNDHESYVIGSEFYQHSVGEEANFIITVKLYDIEMAHSCRLTGGYENSIVITITKHGYLLRTFYIEKSTFIANNGFEFDMRSDVEVVNSLTNSNVNVEADPSSNSSRPPTSTGDGKNRVIVDEKVDGTPDEIKNSITCTICMENKRNVIFMPCSHAIVCKSCTEKIMSSSAPAGAMKCPICKQNIEKILPFYLS